MTAGTLLMLTAVAPTRAFWQRASQCWGKAVDERIARLEHDREQFTACADCGCLSFDTCRLVT